MSQNNIKPITNYTELLAVLNATKVELKDKVKETNWLRYTFRRIPLYSATGLIFFAVCLAIAMVDQIGFKVIDHFLKDIISFVFICILMVLIGTAFFIKRKLLQKKQLNLIGVLNFLRIHYC